MRSNLPGGLCSLVALFVAAGGVLTEIASAHTEAHNPVRARYIMHNGLPSEYRGLSNPLEATSENVMAGAAVYQQRCAVCHGVKGAGDGPAGSGLEPPVPSLTGMGMMEPMRMGHASEMTEGDSAEVSMDAYHFWTVSEGGTDVGSAMPAFKGVLSEEQRWQVVLFILHGLESSMGH